MQTIHKIGVTDDNYLTFNNKELVIKYLDGDYDTLTLGMNDLEKSLRHALCNILQGSEILKDGDFIILDNPLHKLTFKCEGLHINRVDALHNIKDS